jgi:hypothetical protein
MAAADAAPADDARHVAAGRADVVVARSPPATFRVMFGREIADLDQSPGALADASEKAYQVLLRVAETALAPVPPERRPPVELVAFASWSTVHGATMLWLDGPLRCGVPAEEARARFEAGLAFLFRSAAENVR